MDFLSPGLIIDVTTTAHEAADMKAQAVLSGYYADPYIEKFADYPKECFAHQNLNSYLRYKIFEGAVWYFHNKYNGKGTVLVVGCGLDTLFWRCACQFEQWIDIDKEAIVKRRLEIIAEHKLNCPDWYRIEAIDLEQSQTIPNLIYPLVVLDEFSFAYIDPQSMHSFFNQIDIQHTMFVSYSIFFLDDEYSNLIQKTFLDMGIPLKHPHSTESVNEMKTLGFEQTEITTASSIVKKLIPHKEKARISRLDYYDDPQGLTFILEHYSLLCSGSDEFVSTIWG